MYMHMYVCAYICMYVCMYGTMDVYLCRLCVYVYMFAWMYICMHVYPISTLPEHLHSTFPSYAKIPENTLTEKKNFLFPL